MPNLNSLWRTSPDTWLRTAHERSEAAALLADKHPSSAILLLHQASLAALGALQVVYGHVTPPKDRSVWNIWCDMESNNVDLGGRHGILTELRALETLAANLVAPDRPPSRDLRDTTPDAQVTSDKVSAAASAVVELMERVRDHLNVLALEDAPTP